jgi:methyl-accepting chemotaxis protein
VARTQTIPHSRHEQGSTLKLLPLFFATHALVAATSATLFVIAYASQSQAALAGAAVTSLACLAVASWFTSHRIRSGLASLESVVSDHEVSSALTTRILEFDQTAKRIGKCAANWESVAANNRRQARDFQSMITMLNRRDAAEQPTIQQLSDILAGIGRTLKERLQQIEKGAAEIEQNAQAITEGAEEQRHSVIKTTTYVEQLAATIDTVSSNADSAQSTLQITHQSASQTHNVVGELIDGLTRMRAQSQTCEKKLLGLSDPSRQISAIVGTISDITARTNLLALNASIESIRAGEHGRGFAIVADEVRKLAEQAADATREISQLVESMQLVTQESVGGIMRQREQVEREVERAANAQQSLSQICQETKATDDQIRQVIKSANQQLHLAQDIASAVEQISTIAKDHRSGAESVCWTVKSLANSTPSLGNAIDRLRRCGGTANDPAETEALPNATPVPLVAPAVSTPEMVPVV